MLEIFHEWVINPCLITIAQSGPELRIQGIEVLTEYLIGHHEQGAELLITVRQSPISTQGT